VKTVNWKMKAFTQNLVERLPTSMSHTAYYFLQRHFGDLRNCNPIERFIAAVETCKRIEQTNRSPINGVFLEIGTGRRINIPLAFWLMGARRTVTVDLNPYLMEELVREDLEYVRCNPGEIEGLFCDRVYADRLNLLLDFLSRSWRLEDLLKHCRIEYFAPIDAGNLALRPGSIDFHTSYTVLEHIPTSNLTEILEEGNRIVKKSGLFVHRIDLTDHFSHSDRELSAINFLKYSDDTWDRIAGNRFMYMNRLRIDDFRELFEQAEQKILSLETYRNDELAGLLQSKDFSVDERFSNKPIEVLAITGAWIVSQGST
jgi:SAM-dependent methyltransferase